MRTAPFGLAFDLRELANWLGSVARGEFDLSKDGAQTIADSLRECAAESEQLEKALAVARRWGPGMLDLQDCLLRDIAIREGVRAGRVIDLVTVLEREMARNSARQGGAA